MFGCNLRPSWRMATVKQKNPEFSPWVERGPLNPFSLSVCGMCVRPEREIREKVGHQSPERAGVSSGVV